MIQTLRDFLQRLAPSAPGPADARDAEHRLQLATAVMLVEVMRAEGEHDPAERAAVLAALRDKFDLSVDEAARLADLAETAAGQATDLYAFTSHIDEHFDMERKVRMVEHLWRVAYSDGRLGDHERQRIWRISDLLHVPDGARVHARMRAQAQLPDEAPDGDAGVS